MKNNLIIFLSLCSIALFLTGSELFNSEAIDFSSFYYVGVAVSDNANPYDLSNYTNQEKHIYPYIYTPILAQTLSLFIFISEPNLLVIWRLFSILLFSFTIQMLLISINKTNESLLTLVAVGSVAIVFSVMRYVIIVGQIDLIIISLIILSYLYYKKNNIISALFLALAIIFKIFPIFLLFYFIIKDRKFSILVVFWTGIIVLLSIILFGYQDWSYFFEIALRSASDPSFAKIAPIDAEYNSSVLSIYFQFFDLTTSQILQKITFSMTLLFLILSYRKKSINSEILYLNLFLITALFWIPFLWRQHFIYIFPSLILNSYFLIKRKSFLSLVFLGLSLVLAYDSVKMLNLFQLSIEMGYYNEINKFALLGIFLITFYQSKKEINLLN